MHRIGRAPRRALQRVRKPPTGRGQIALAGQRPPDERAAKAREKRSGDAAPAQSFDSESAAADADEPSRHREFVRAVPPAPIPDAGLRRDGS